MSDTPDQQEPIIKEIIGVERSYYFEKRNVKSERQRKIREIIERHTSQKGASDDS